MNKKHTALTGFLLFASVLTSLAHAEPRLIVTSASLITKGSILSTVSASWTTIESNAVYPTSLHPYDEGYRSYGPALQAREYSDATHTSYTEYWDTLYANNRIMINITPTDTWATLAAKYADKAGASGTSIWPHSTVANHYALVRACTVVTRQNVGYTRDNVMPDPLSCNNIPEVENPAVCDIAIIGSNNLDHETLNESAVNGHTATATATLSCTKPATVEFRVLNQPVELGNGITSTVKINDSLSPVVSVNNPTNVTIKSTLAASNPQPGPFAGNTIIIANVQ
ncbi:hypothetical protein ACQ86O_07960 [Serratia sp. L9]|uniref:hypothetical protein n=1 Tax=Serratia sp. L9 TaxID=3423946 RepID=UPI003D67C6AB